MEKIDFVTKKRTEASLEKRQGGGTEEAFFQAESHIRNHLNENGRRLSMSRERNIEAGCVKRHSRG